MAAKQKVQDAHISAQMKALHEAMSTIVSVMNRPRNDEKMIEQAGVELDRALFSVLIGIERLGPIGVVELAEHAGRDYTTVSRQVARLESLGLVKRRASEHDRRVHEALISAKGKAITERIDAARERIGRAVFQNWDKDELDLFVQLMQRFAEALEQETSAA